MTPSPRLTAPSTRPFGLLVTIFLIIELTPIFETTMMSTALPTFISAFGIDTSTASWLITIFLLVGAGSAAIAGRLGDAVGRKPVLLTLMTVSALGSVVSLMFGSFVGVLIGRALQGTSAGLFPLLIGLAREVTTAKRVSLLSSLTSGVSVIGGALGAVAAGVLLQAAGWRSMFVASGILAVVAIGFAVFLPKPIGRPTQRTGFDALGAVLLAPSIAAILFGFTISRTVGVSLTVIGFVLGGVVLFAFWLVWELRVARPMFNLRLFRQPSLVLAMLATALAAIGIMSGPGLLTPLLQQTPASMPVGLGLTPTQAGLYSLVSAVVSFAVTPFAGRVAGRFGAKVVLVAGIALGTIGYAGFYIAVHSLSLSIVAILIGGVGLALIVVAVPLVIVEIVPPTDTSEAVGLIYTVGRTVFSAVGTAIIGVLLTTSTVPNTTVPTLSAWFAGVSFVVAAGILGVVVTLFIKKSRPLDRREAPDDPAPDALAETPVETAPSR
ncbi:MAG: MFS transporter [Microbacteriaceae bacterium]